MFNPGPSTPVKLVAFGLSAGVLLAVALAAAATLPRLRADLPACLAATVSFTIVAAVFWGQSRYLAPLHGLMIAAAAAWIAPRAARFWTSE